MTAVGPRRQLCYTNPPTPDEPAGQIGALGQVIVQHLFSAGLDLNFLLMLSEDDGPRARHARHAIADLDEAIRLLRHLIIAHDAPA